MSASKIFPDSIVNSCTENLISVYRKTTPVIYLSVLMTVVVAFVALFFVKVQVGVNATGIIKPKGERTILTAPVSGKLKVVNLNENAFVQKGETLFIIEAPMVTAQLPAYTNRKIELEAMISDLQSLVDPAKEINVLTMKSPVYIQSYLSHIAQINDYSHKEQVAMTNYARQEKLYKSKTIPAVEFEQAAADLKNAELAHLAFTKSVIAKWQSELNSMKNERRDLDVKIQQIKIQDNETVVIAPLSGAIQSIEKVSNAMFVHAGQQIAEISPAGQLVAECYVSTKDIGLIHVQQNTRIRVDAFNYNDWGVLEGTITEIFNDIIVPENNQPPYYRIYCSINDDHLSLKNGRKGYLKKGMTVTGRFMVTERTLFQLIYDKIDNWLNPHLTGHEA